MIFFYTSEGLFYKFMNYKVHPFCCECQIHELQSSSILLRMSNS
ncbi:hypothetical protein M153_7700019487 [Pseudoloma neurophilia]|uniref:Uncharacterized protein n=1 Tax=Pseudoloma neurophilia TaxID=146866 RepID=A0A0R0M6F3_9MICR|nr:hypothetical protein M153_7700019487 [Pseudoloma neurophilia]